MRLRKSAFKINCKCNIQLTRNFSRVDGLETASLIWSENDAFISVEWKVKIVLAITLKFTCHQSCSLTKHLLPVTNTQKRVEYADSVHLLIPVLASFAFYLTLMQRKLAWETTNDLTSDINVLYSVKTFNLGVGKRMQKLRSNALCIKEQIVDESLVGALRIFTRNIWYFLLTLCHASEMDWVYFRNKFVVEM